jgi:ATP-dependent Lon protease
MELLQMIHELVPEGDEVAVHLITQSDADTAEKQAENLDQIASSFVGSRVAFSWELGHSPNFHARSITTDTGWKITVDRVSISFSGLKADRSRWSRPFRKPG